MGNSQTVLGLGLWALTTMAPGFNSLLKELRSCRLVVGFPWWLSNTGSTCQCRRREFDPWFGKTPWRRKWQRTPVLLPGESHGQRSLEGGLQSVGSQRVRHS